MSDPRRVVLDASVGIKWFKVPLSDRVVREALVQCRVLGCTFYDALAPALATIHGATLSSADRRAHGGFEGVVLL
jgi:predicted nucleic acid-binding protein